MKHGRKRRLAKFFSLPVLALCGFLIAATLAGVGLATDSSTTDTSSTISSTNPPPPPPPSTTTTTTTTPTGNEGCTPGFWKNNADKKGASQWTDPYDPTDLVSSVFDTASFTSIGNLTLLQGLQLGGGGANALTRHAIAAVLSAAHPDIDYPLTVDEIVDMVNAAYASGDADTIESLKDTLDRFNNLNCSISQNA